MDIYSSFIAYLVLYRLAITAAGVLSIYWGYRLFIQLAIIKQADTNSKAAAEKGTNAEMSITKDVKIKLTNAAPGALFAMFGAGIIIAMIVGGTPNLMLESMKNAKQASEKVSFDKSPSPLDGVSATKEKPNAKKTNSSKGKTTTKAAKKKETAMAEPTEVFRVQMRGDGLSKDQKKEVLQLLAKNSTSKKEWNDAKYLLAQRFNKDAWQQYKTKDYTTALFNVNLSLQFEPTYWNALDTKAEILLAQNNSSKAKTALKKAIKYAPSSQKTSLESKLASW